VSKVKSVYLYAVNFVEKFSLIRDIGIASKCDCSYAYSIIEL
jgi:hypothetical protein